jgi:DNA polymerase III subunit delta'
MAFQADKALEFLARGKERGRLGHAYLITGPKEAELTGFAVRFLNLVADTHHTDLDIWEKRGICLVRPESKSRQIKVEAVREQVEPFLFITSSGQEHRFCVFVDAERMNQQAQNAILRTLEEPPPRTLFLLLSEHPQQFLETILSRVITIPLMPLSKEKKLSESEHRLVELLSDLAERPSDSLAGAMTLRREFEDILEDIHTRLTKQLEADFDAEKKFYKQTTDVDSGWLKDRENETEASIESRYRQERDALMELLLTWMGDVLRHQVGVDRLDLPEYAAATQALAQRWDSATLNRRLKELRKLHSHLHTNVQESLALDAAFIAAFA